MLRLSEAAYILSKWTIVKLLILVPIAALAPAQHLAPCELNDRFPDVRGRWVKTRGIASSGGYDEAICPDFVHLTDCLRQSKDRRKTLAEYRYVTRCGRDIMSETCYPFKACTDALK